MASKIKGLLFQNQNLRQTIIKNTFWLVVGEAFNRFLRIALIIYAARILGASQYGVLSYILSLVAFFTVIADSGINLIVIRETNQKPALASQYFITSLWLKTVILAFIVFVIYFGMPYVAKLNNIQTFLPFALALLVFDVFRNSAITFFRAKEKMELEAFVNLITNVLILILGFGVLFYKPSALNILFVYGIGVVIGALAGAIILKKELFNIFKFFKKELIRPLISSAFTLAILTMFGVAMLNTDIIIIGFFRNEQEIGFYSASQKIIQLLFIFAGLIANAFFPSISRLAEQEDKKEKLKNLFERGITIMFILAIPLALGGIILSQDIINLLYGPEYAPAVLTFQLLCLTLLFAFPGMFISNLILAFGKQKQLTPYVISGLLLNIALDIIFIPRWGIAGSALATICVISFYTISNLRLAKKLIHLTIVPYLKKIIFAALIMGGVSMGLNFLGVFLLFNILLSGLIYFLILYLLKEKTIWDFVGILKNKIA